MRRAKENTRVGLTIKEAMAALERGLPALPAPLRTEEDGGLWRPGFWGNISQSPLYVTDGHILLLVNAIDPEFAIEVSAEWTYLKRYATEAKIDLVWKPAERRDDVIAEFIGVCRYVEDPAGLAFLRDVTGRVMIVNAHLLSFGVRAVRPDTLTVSAAPFGSNFPWDTRRFDTPLALRRDGKLVGLLVPMRLSADDYPEYDMHGEAVSLAEAVGA